ncbi:hypothetical protein EDD85DRAFT_144640 [Armillaria nabsnona]|nr:hypothetical protein EDD85DRAFT_144640 [Armillaria nabsnona]
MPMYWLPPTTQTGFTTSTLLCGIVALPDIIPTEEYKKQRSVLIRQTPIRRMGSPRVRHDAILLLMRLLECYNYVVLKACQVFTPTERAGVATNDARAQVYPVHRLYIWRNPTLLKAFRQRSCFVHPTLSCKGRLLQLVLEFYHKVCIVRCSILC